MIESPKSVLEIKGMIESTVQTQNRGKNPAIFTVFSLKKKIAGKTLLIRTIGSQIQGWAENNVLFPTIVKIVEVMEKLTCNSI